MVEKRLVFLLISLLSIASMSAQEVGRHSISADLTAQGLVGFNNTYQWYGGANLKGVLHLDNTDISFNVEALTKNVYSLGLTMCPSFHVCVNGFVFVEGTLHSRIFANYKTYEFVYAGSAGFKMRHFSVQIGLFSRTIDALDRDLYSLDNNVTEPFNFLYKLKISIMGFDNPWDVYLIGANFNDYEYERMWEPLCTLGGRWDFRDRWSAVAEGTLKPAGMFHGNVKFYEAMLRIGMIYKLKNAHKD